MTVQKLRVCHIIHSLGAGGAEGVLSNLAFALKGVEVDTVVIGLSDAEDARAVPPLRTAGATVYQLHRSRYDVRAVLDIVRILRSEEIDVVHTHLKHADVVGGIAARLCFLPAVSTLHVIESRLPTLSSRLRLRLATLARACCFSTIICLSTAQQTWYRQHAAKARLRLVPNGVEEPRPLSDRRQTRQLLGVSDQDVLVVTLSLMRPEKGHEVLLEAVRRIPPISPVRFLLAGDGPLFAQLAATVAGDALLRSRVRLLGFREDTDELLAAADLVVHPSSEDALPTALIQALAVGRAIVATSVGGVPDIVAHDCGRLVPAGDSARLAAAVAELSADSELRERYAESARLRYVNHFSASLWARRLRSVYDTALGRLNGGPPDKRLASRAGGKTRSGRS